MSLVLHQERRLPPINLGTAERCLSAAAGAVLLVNGVLRPSAPATLLAAAGALLVARGLTGYCPLYGLLGIDRAPGRALPRAAASRSAAQSSAVPGIAADPVDAASEASFPASDAPSWTAVGAVGRPD